MHLVSDVPCTVSILECVQCLHEVTVGWADACNHESPAVPSQRVLKHTGELAVSVGHVTALLGLVTQCTDHITQSKLKWRMWLADSINESSSTCI